MSLTKADAPCPNCGNTEEWYPVQLGLYRCPGCGFSVRVEETAPTAKQQRDPNYRPPADARPETETRDKALHPPATPETTGGATAKGT